MQSMKDGRYSLRIVSLHVQVAETPGKSLNGPDEVTPIVQAYFSSVRDDRERFVALMLTSKHSLLGITEVGLGGTTLTVVDPKVLFRTLLVKGAMRFIIAHNHPSGDPSPSPEDRALTTRLRAAGELLGLQCLDHLIVGDGTEKVFSFLDHGLFGDNK